MMVSSPLYVWLPRFLGKPIVTSSNFLFISRQTQTVTSGNSALKTLSVSCILFGDSKKQISRCFNVFARFLYTSSCFSSWEDFLGRKPTNKKFSNRHPESTPAFVIAEEPGIDV